MVSLCVLQWRRKHVWAACFWANSFRVLPLWHEQTDRSPPGPSGSNRLTHSSEQLRGLIVYELSSMLTFVASFKTSFCRWTEAGFCLTSRHFLFLFSLNNLKLWNVLHSVAARLLIVQTDISNIQQLKDSMFFIYPGGRAERRAAVFSLPSCTLFPATLSTLSH